MTHILVKFVEDELYHVCPKGAVLFDREEVGLVSAKYKGMYFRAVVVSEGGKSEMNELMSRCITNDRIVARYKFRQEDEHHTVNDDQQNKNICRNLPSSSQGRSESKWTELMVTQDHNNVITLANMEEENEALIEMQADTTDYDKLLFEEGIMIDITNKPDSIENHSLLELTKSQLVNKCMTNGNEQDKEGNGRHSVTGENFTEIEVHANNYDGLIVEKDSKNEGNKMKINKVVNNSVSSIPELEYDFTVVNDVNNGGNAPTNSKAKDNEAFDLPDYLALPDDDNEDDELENMEVANDGGSQVPILNELSDNSDETNHTETTITDNDEHNQKKKYFCPFCKSKFSKFARHIFQVHDGEDEVSQIKFLNKKNPKRLQIISKLRAKGLKMYNDKQTPDNAIVTRVKKNSKPEEYIQCNLCGNMYKHSYLHRHVKKCPNSNGPQTQPLRTARAQQYKVPDETDDAIKYSQDVIAGMKEGEIKHTIQTDSVLQKYGKYLCAYYAPDVQLVNLIRRKLRQIAEVLIEIKKIDSEILCLNDIFQARKKSVLFEAIKNVTGHEKGKFQRPAMAVEMSTLLQKCAQRVISQAYEENNDERVKEVSRWVEIVKFDYNALISKQARRTLDERKWNKPRTLPLTEDVLKLNQHVKQMADESSKKLKKEFDYIEWQKLNKATMVKIIVFNRKRVGDVEKMRVNDFKNCHNVQKGSVTYDLLSESEKLNSSKYMRVENQGKHARVVPLLLTKDIVSHIKQILQFRKEAGISDANPFVFAKVANTSFQGSRVMAEMAYSCEAKFPQFLTGTKMRKQIATASQAFNFSENDLSLLAGFLGHNLQTHKQFYRLPDEAIQLAKISTVLQAIDSGRVGELKGKSLAELEDVVQKMLTETENDDDEKGEDDPDKTFATEEEKTPKKKVKVVRKTWTTPEKIAMRRHFKTHLEKNTLPTPLECSHVKNKNSPLKSRTVAQMKAWVFNQNRKK